MAVCRFFKQLVLVVLWGAVMLSGVPLFAAGTICHELVSKPKTSIAISGPTANLIAYISELSEMQILSTKELGKILSSLTEKQRVNPLVGRNDTASYVHRDVLGELLTASDVDVAYLSHWLQKEFNLRADDERTRSFVEGDTKLILSPIVFHPVKAGSTQFYTNQLSSNDDKYACKLTRDFEMMESPVTQYQWAELMKSNPSTHSFGLEGTLVEIHGQKIKMQPNHPVETITWLSAMAFANRLSVQHGLKPAYDLDGLEFEPGTSAEAGTLSLKVHWTPGGAAIQKQTVKINAPNGNIYEAEGYRLPTTAEHTYVRAAIPQESRTQDNFGSLKDAPLVSTSIHEAAVDILKGSPFSGLYKNVFEWAYDHNPYSVQGTDALEDPDTTTYRTIAGDAWESIEPSFRLYNAVGDGTFGSLYAMDARGNLGFRLVRTIKKPSFFESILQNIFRSSERFRQLNFRRGP